MRSLSLKKMLVTSAVGMAALVFGANLTSAQNANREYRDWQRAQAEVQRECSGYGWRGNSGDCQRAQARAQKEYNDYQRAVNRNGYYNNGYGNYGNNGYYNNGAYNNGYYNNGAYNNGYYGNRNTEMLRNAVNQGYRDGYNRGSMDRRYRRGYGGNGYYDNRGYDSTTQYYYQQGFQRGYEDGYNNTMRYGYRSGNSYSVVGSILGTILNLASQ